VSTAFFVSDLHGHVDRYEKLFAAIAAERPDAVFLGGDLLPHPAAPLPAGVGAADGFLDGYLLARLDALRAALGAAYPRVFAIFGNDDARAEEEAAEAAARRGTWLYAHGRKHPWGERAVYGYACIPPSPFRLKDWERYDVSRFVDPGSLAPDEGFRTAPLPAGESGRRTILEDLAHLFGDDDLARAIFLCHVPPYDCALDRAALDGRTFEHAPLDVHIGSIAVRRAIEARQPRLSLHGHVHESARLTGAWRDRIGATVCVSAAHDGPELALVRFDPERPDGAVRELL